MQSLAGSLAQHYRRRDLRGRMKQLCAPVVVVFFRASVAPGLGATFSQRPPSTNPSGTATYQFMVRSDGGDGENGGVAYKIPGGAWQRCKPSNTQFTMTDLPDGSYTVLIADDISLEYWNARGLLYSGHTAPCATPDPPATTITSYTFTVGPQASSAGPAPAPPPPAPTQTVVTAPAPSPSAAPATALGAVEARRLAKGALRKRYHRAYSRGKAKRLVCNARLISHSRCRFSFAYKRFRYSGTASVFKDATGVDIEVRGKRRRRA